VATLRISLAQINTSVGDISGNVDKIVFYLQEARKLESDIVAFPELAITGYPPEDLLHRSQFLKSNIVAMQQIVKESKDIVVIFGFADSDGSNLYNSAALAFNSKIIGVHRKHLLPNYGVFDEQRYFSSGNTCDVFKIDDTKIAINICEDIWSDNGPLNTQSNNGASLIININASPFHIDKRITREKTIINQAIKNNVQIAYVNQVGGQDELVFDGSSMIVDNNGKIKSRASQFSEDLITHDVNIKNPKSITTDIDNDKNTFYIPKYISEKSTNITTKLTNPIAPIEEIYQALVIGTQDYVYKSGFKKVIIALSGGIDSSLVAAIAVESFGKDNVTGISMPSEFSSEGSKTDAYKLSENLGINIKTIPINDIFNLMQKSLQPMFNNLPWDVAEENIQSRIRGNIIMALSNKFNSMVLTTGNKSEMAVGYATIYGDMAGGFSVIKDVPKLKVYELCNHINNKEGKEIIPSSIIDKPPSAELRHNQQDTDSLPPYEILDAILEEYIENDSSYEDIINSGFDANVVSKIINLVDKTEYKRRQSAPGVKITNKNFGRDRRIPITNKYSPFESKDTY
tara:strand:- start:2897 stop:4612 length:1716 start_codon:yes stop_codon:yes gene_type:complete